MKSMPCPLACMAAVLCLYAQTATPAIADELTVIQAEQLHLGTGEVLSPGSVAVRDGKIVEVGAAVEAGDANVISVHTLIPGLIDACSQAGLSGQSDERTDETTPDLQVIDVVDWTDRAFQEQVADGCTTVNVVPGTENVISGQSAVVKTSGTGENRVITDSSGLWLAMCRDPTSGNRSRSRPDSIYVRQPTNRMGVVWLLRSTFHAAGAESSAASPLNAVLDDKANAFCVSRTHYDIEASAGRRERIRIPADCRWRS
jgi:imidazolonepropionase-like amidohydrolase